MDLALNKYSLRLFTTNIVSTVIFLFFMQSYARRGDSIAQLFLLFFLVLFAFLAIIIYVLKIPTAMWIPPSIILAVNILLSIVISFFFVADIGILGAISVVVLATLLTEIEHMIRVVR